MKTRTATRGVDDIKSELMKYYHQLPVTEDNCKAVRAVAWALLANVLISDYLNRWNEAGAGGNPGDNLLTDAETAVGKALNLDDTFALAHYANGLVLRARGRCTEALHAFERAINLDSTFARAYAQKGSELINDGQFDDALTEIDKAIKAGPADPSLGMFYWNRGRAYFFKEQYDDAIAALKDAVKFRSNLWHNELYLAAAYWKLNDQSNATKIVQDFLKKNPGFTVERVISHEKANPSKNQKVKEGRDRFHEALEKSGMPPR
jgi:tetratricopeptide (TPR) repeat protein